MSNRNNQKQIWTDPEFKLKLMRIKAKIQLKNGDDISIARLTKKILQCKKWEELEKELMNVDVKLKGLKIKTDKRLL